MLDWKWDYERPLVFTQVLLTKTLGARKAREIQVSIDLRLELWERGIYAGLVVGALS